jgi:hypothetical protein
LSAAPKEGRRRAEPHRSREEIRKGTEQNDLSTRRVSEEERERPKNYAESLELWVGAKEDEKHEHVQRETERKKRKERPKRSLKEPKREAEEIADAARRQSPLGVDVRGVQGPAA